MRTHPRFYIYTNTIFAVRPRRLSFFVWLSDIYCFDKYNNHLICFVEHRYITHMTFCIWIDIVHLDYMNKRQEIAIPIIIIVQILKKILIRHCEQVESNCSWYFYFAQTSKCAQIIPPAAHCSNPIEAHKFD